MKRFLAVLAVAISAPALAQNADAIPVREAAAPLAETISVTGSGRSSMTPDRYIFTAGVQTIEPTVDDAVRENNSRTAAVIAALKKAGAEQKEIRTANFSIWPQQQFVQGQSPRITGYQVSNTLTVTSDKVGDAGRMLQAAIDAGANASSGLQFEVSDPIRGRDEGLRAAFDDARAKATVLAQAAGRTLGRALTISDVSAGPPVMPFGGAMAMRAGAAPQVPVEAGTQERLFTVSVVFALK